MSHIRPLPIAALLASVALPVAAQEICGGNGIWIGGSEATSDIATADAYREQMALVLSGNEYVSLFTLSEPASVRIEAAGRGNGDPLISLTDTDGTMILTDDDSGGNMAARAETDLGPGTYCVNVASFEGAPMTAFVRIARTDQEALTTGVDTVDVSDDPDPELFPAVSCADAPSLGVLDGVLTGSAPAQETPTWQFDLSAPTAISVTASNEDADPLLVLTDLEETFLGENDDFDGLNARIDMADPLPAGTYCISVEALSDPALPIEIAVTTYDPVAALEGLYARGEAAPPLDGSHPVTALGSLAARLRQDANVTDTATWFSLDIDESGLLLIEAIAAGGNGDPWLVLYDDLGRQLAQNDDNGDGLDSLLTARVAPGTYIVGVKQVGAGTQGFIRMLFERYVLAP